MKHKYTAKIHLADGETLLKTGDDIEQLWCWMSEQAEASFDEINGEIIDNTDQHIVKHFQYAPSE